MAETNPRRSGKNRRIPCPARPEDPAGESIEFSYERGPEPEVNRNVEILHEDENLLVINKPPDLPVHPSGRYFRNTLYFLLKERFGDDFRCHFVHRLDRETSGVLLMARNGEITRLLQKSFLTGAVHKEYRVMVEGVPPKKIQAKGFQFRDGKSPVHRKWNFFPGEAPRGLPEEVDARTDFELLEEKKGISLLRAVLFTGRMHQIRATLCSLGYPVVGDPIYGLDETIFLRLISDTKTEEDRKLLRMGRTALHAGLLRLPHPITGRTMEFRSPIPEDMRRLMNELGFSADEF